MISIMLLLFRKKKKKLCISQKVCPQYWNSVFHCAATLLLLLLLFLVNKYKSREHIFSRFKYVFF